MPVRIVAYARYLIQGYMPTATFLAQQFAVSHDHLSRTIRQRFAWQQIMLVVVQRLFGVLQGGYLLIDDTVIPKPYAKKMDGASYVHSSVLNKTVYGYNVVLLCWTNGTLTIPLSWKFYKKGGKSKIALALDLLAEARDVWKLSPRYVLFDSWYAAETLLNTVHLYGWSFVCQIKKNRIVSCAPIKENLTDEGDLLISAVTSQVIGLIIKHDEKFFFTNDCSLTLEQLLCLYGYRWPIEEVFRFLKDQLHLEGCQARSATAQETHLASCILSYLIIQRQQQDLPEQTMYAIKRHWLLNRRLGNNRFNHYVKVLTA